MKNYDVIIIGAGSVGTPLAYYLAGERMRVLVIESLPSPGQGQNKRAIGGIRATHSDRAKIKLCQKSIDIFSRWKEETGDELEWKSNGYSFPAYTDKDAQKFKDLLVTQKSFGLNIDWLDADDYLKLVPHINPKDLRGGTFSPNDGSASPLLSANSFYFKARERGAEFHFREQVESITMTNNAINTVKTDKDEYGAGLIVNAAGSYAKDIAAMVNIDLPVKSDCHEGGISAPVAPFLGPMVVDMRAEPGSKNYYFYQHATGQIVFCITPDPPIWGIDDKHTSVFLPQVAKRMVKLMPILQNIEIRRTWRGMYPMTPDGFPIVGRVKEIDGFYNLAGMCGQGFMLGPGLGYYVAKDIMDTIEKTDKEILGDLTLYREFTGQEAFK